MNNKLTLAVTLMLVTGASSLSAANVVDTHPTTGTATINGQEIRYYVSADKKFLNLDTPEEMIVSRFTIGTESSTTPAGYEGSFTYKDKQGVTRKAHYKTLTKIPKSHMTADK